MSWAKNDKEFSFEITYQEGEQQKWMCYLNNSINHSILDHLIYKEQHCNYDLYCAFNRSNGVAVNDLITGRDLSNTTVNNVADDEIICGHYSTFGNEETSVYFFSKIGKSDNIVVNIKYPELLLFVNFRYQKRQYLFGIFDIYESFRCIYDEEKGTIDVVWEKCNLFSVIMRDGKFVGQSDISQSKKVISIKKDRISCQNNSDPKEYQISLDYFKVHKSKS